ncbi:MAG: hypothetical protein KJ930_04940 [Gammaproteobacteria bacterium]|jgi:hypothetical protein|nr:hypothetical protein [Gammaproteobacteria bacterium]MBU2178764.1 hypothetical protein [Gammaproteobacteria bacterium]MBU2225305.1 hypothetical protein [Gammaproteobacteria bacterium]MBU2278702.1 hypothetical protein [Gammaproteobacteria bacterium]MBU2426076.1 hypothetical protein [Gammaproteobacteria bacterium]
MPVMLKKILALIVGLVVCIAIVALLEQLAHQLLATPSANAVDTEDPTAASAYMKNLPVAAYLMVLLAWGAGTAAGIAVASILVKRVSRLFVPVITGMMLLSTIANFYLLPHPWWLMITAVVMIPLIGIFTGLRLSRRFNSTKVPDKVPN